MITYGAESQKVAARIREELAEKPARKIKLPKVLAVIDQSGCTGCEACIQFCPVDCIELVPGADFVDHGKLVEVDLDRCIGCKRCAKYCPWDTIHMVGSAEAETKSNEWTLRSVIAPDLVGAQIWPREVPEDSSGSSSSPAQS